MILTFNGLKYSKIFVIYIFNKNTINRFIGDITAIPLLEAPLEEATDVDDFINDVRSRNARESSLIPNVFKQDLNTAMPANIGNTVTNMNVPYDQMTIAQKIEYDNMVRGR